MRKATKVTSFGNDYGSSDKVVAHVELEGNPYLPALISCHQLTVMHYEDYPLDGIDREDYEDYFREAYDRINKHPYFMSDDGKILI